MAIFGNAKHCDQCNRTLLGKGRERGGYRFCSEKCEQAKYLQLGQTMVPASEVLAAVEAIRNGPCPVCKIGSPVGLHASYRIWSIIRFTRYSTRQTLSCLACDHKEQWKDLGFCSLLGWWGIPFGIIMTPVYIGRNIRELRKNDSDPSVIEALRHRIQTEMGLRVAASNTPQSIPAPPIPNPTPGLQQLPMPDPTPALSTPTNPMQTHT